MLSVLPVSVLIAACAAALATNASASGRNRYISRISADAQPTLIDIINLYGTSMSAAWVRSRHSRCNQ